MFLQNRLHRLAFLLLLGPILVSTAWAGTVGKISGVVTGRESGQPLAGANITIVGTTMGATADAAGRYFVLNVPAGTYQLQATLVGYKPVVLGDVRVAPDFTTEADFALEQTVLGVVQTVEIRAEKPLIQKDLTGTTRFLGREEVENLPARGYQNVASQQAGIVAQSLTPVGAEASNAPRLYVRGGRAEEVAYYVDGFSQQDPLTGLSTTSVNQNAIDQIVVMTGGFNAEYGKIMSGAVNVITREGEPEYFGSVEVVTDNRIGEWLGAKSYDWNIYDASLGGPVIPGTDQLTFFLSGESRWQRDRAPKPIEKLGFTGEQKALYKDGRLPNNDLSGYTWQAKGTWQLGAPYKIRVGTLNSRDDWQEYRHSYLFNLPHTPRYQDTNKSLFGTFTHTINPRTFYSFGANWFYTERFRGDGRYFKDLDAYSRPDGNPTYDPGTPLFWYGPTEDLQRIVGSDTTYVYSDSTASVWDDYLHRESSYFGFKGDMTIQWTPTNQAKVGAEYRDHTLRRYRHLFPYRMRTPQGLVDVDRFGYALDDPEKPLDRGLDGAKHPKDASFYVQNKYEKDQFILNAGLRYDYLDVDTKIFANEELPLGEDRAVLDPEDLEDSKVRHKLSPRLGVGFPVSERTQFHANYGIFFQQPNLEDLYTGFVYGEYKVREGGYYYPFGNPNLTPETTTAYEVGFTQQVSERARIDLTAFYKNVQDLVQVQSIRSSPNSYSSFRNTDYGTIKGVDFAFDLRRTSNLAAQLNYTYSFANGTGSVANSQRNIAWTGGIAPKQTAPLDFDQRHKISANVDYRFEKGQGPVIGGLRPFEKMGVNVLINISSGNPYTPTKAYDEVTLAAVTIQPSGSINSLYGPWRNRVDMKLDRGFAFGRYEINAYLWVLNVLNRVNPVAVYSSSGDPAETGWLTTPTGALSYSTDEERGLYGLAQRNPNNYDSPRMVRFGLRTSF